MITNLRKDMMETFRVKLKTAKTEKDMIDKNKKLNLSKIDLENLHKYYNMINGLEIKVITFMGQARLIDYEEKDESIIREAKYLLEQNSKVGIYIDDYKTFRNKWDSGKYYNEDIEMVFEISEIEII